MQIGKMIRNPFTWVSLLLVISVAISQYQINLLKRERVVYLYLFGGITMIPNDYVLKVESNSETLLFNNEGRILVGHNPNREMIDNVKSYGAVQAEQCGVSILKADKNIKLDLLYTTQDFLLFSNVDEDVIENALHRLCLSKKKGRELGYRGRSDQ